MAAVAGGLRLIGVRWSFVPLLLLWPPLAIGIQVGNVACFSFLVLAAAWSVPEVIPLGGVFKPQTGLMALWLVRERRLRTLAVGLGGLALGIIATLPLTGIAIYGEWLRSLRLFQDWLVIHPGVMAFALQRSFGGLAAAGIAVVVVIVALLAGGRDGLARIAVGATAASPTVYVHGFSLVLPSILFLDAASVWAVLALAPWGRVFWPAVALVLLALVLGLTRTRLAGAGTGDGEPTSGERDDSRLHPLGGLPGTVARPAGQAAGAARPIAVRTSRRIPAYGFVEGATLGLAVDAGAGVKQVTSPAGIVPLVPHGTACWSSGGRPLW